MIIKLCYFPVNTFASCPSPAAAGLALMDFSRSLARLMTNGTGISISSVYVKYESRVLTSFICFATICIAFWGDEKSIKNLPKECTFYRQIIDVLGIAFLLTT